MHLEDFLRKRSPEPIRSVLTRVARTSLKVWESIPFRSGLLDMVNPSGERQTAIDVFTNDLFADELLKTGHVSEVASEEMRVPRKGGGTLHLSMDPLDGSSNVETNNPLGSIFGIYDTKLPCSGEHLKTAAYITYGPMLTVTIALQGGVSRFVAVRGDSSIEFELQSSSLRIPDTAGVYGIGGLRKDWTSPVQAFVSELDKRGMKVRYCGTFVGDFNQIMKHGGIFGYPSLITKPRGKLRVLYETAPMAFIAKAAGGYSTSGTQDILKIKPRELSETSPAFLGSRSIVRELERALSST